MEKYRIAVGIPTLKDCSLEAIACSELIIGDGAIISLPSSYNQRRTVMLNYEVLANIYKSRKGHKLDEWNQLCGWIEGCRIRRLLLALILLKSRKITPEKRVTFPIREVHAIFEYHDEE